MAILFYHAFHVRRAPMTTPTGLTRHYWRRQRQLQPINPLRRRHRRRTCDACTTLQRPAASYYLKTLENPDPGKKKLSSSPYTRDMRLTWSFCSLSPSRRLFSPHHKACTCQQSENIYITPWTGIAQRIRECHFRQFVRRFSLPHIMTVLDP